MWAGRRGEPPDEEWIRRMGPPDNEIPVALPLNAVVARTDDVAVAVLGVLVYSTGLAFELAVRLRAEAATRLDLQQAMWGPPRPGRIEGRFLVGLEFADGRRVMNVRMPEPGAELVLHPSGGGGGPHGFRQSWWLSPLPPEGPVRLVVRCPDAGVPESSTELDGTAIRRAAADVVELWPWSPPDREPPEQPVPEMPPDSWFAG